MICVRLVLLSLLYNAAKSEQPTLNECDEINAGDIYFSYIASMDPDVVVLFTFEGIPGNIKLYLTDNAWTGSSFQANEGTLEVRSNAIAHLV